MKRVIWPLAFMICLFLPGLADAQMGDYCSAPPYVTRSIIPNVLIMMDNSPDMQNQAYTDNYDNTKTYEGYFNSGSCYSYSSGAFNEAYKNASYQPYTMSDTCPSTAPFRGNLMNWATTSRYDILQKILVGGNSVSKQGNVNTLLSVSGNWTKTYGNCNFVVNNANLSIQDVTPNSCTLINPTPTPIALLDDDFKQFPRALKRIYYALVHGAESTFTYVADLWDRVGGAAKALASSTLSVSVSTGTLNGTAGVPYSITLEAGGNNNATFSWNVSSKPSWMTIGPTYSSQGQKTNYHMTVGGTPPAPGDFTFSGSVSDNRGDTPGAWSYTIHVAAAPLVMDNPSLTSTTLPSGTQFAPYSFTASAHGGIGPYTWSATGLNALGLGLSIDPATGIISGTPSVAATYGSISISVTDSQGTTVTVSGLSMTVAVNTLNRSTQYNVKVGMLEETLNDLNGNNIWDLGETFTDLNGNGVWDGKQGLLQQFWDDNNPRARWGLMSFGYSGGAVKMVAGPCIPASPLNSFLTGIQNATANPDSPLAQGLYGALNYYIYSAAGSSLFSSTAFQGCGSSDPIPNDQYMRCRKNFVLIISSGSDVGPASGANFTATGCTVPNGNSSAPLVQNACYGSGNDLRNPDRDGTQVVYTYIVNTMGTNAANNNILQDAAAAGGGRYYAANDASDLAQQLKNALTDILAAAASGTAVSVLTTSSRGSGSMIQAYFLPTRQDGTRQVTWTGYTQNLWIDPQDNLREDTLQTDYQLKLDHDQVLKLYFDNSTNQTMAATFTTLADGTGGSLAACSPTTIKKFSDVAYLWEAGKKLATTRPGDRTIYTSSKVIRGTATPYTFVGTQQFTATNIDGNAAMTAALNADATYSADSIIGYVRGECLETGSTGNNACGSTVSTVFRDRRITVDGTPTVWKLGDVISSTPKVFSNTPLNTYHLDYGDGSYYSYITSRNNTDTGYSSLGPGGYANKSAVAFVGANDGMLHAFRVGYLNSTGLLDGVIALFQDFFSGDTGQNHLGDEIWGFIPFNAFPYLKYLADPGYCHLYYNDLSVRLVDASVGADPGSPKDVSSWRTILIGGMRFGGAPAGGTPSPPISGVGFSAYYAIDVTNPEVPVPLWEFSDDDLGYASTFPSVIRTGDKATNGNWYVVIGSGSTVLPKSQTDIGRTTPGYVYILNLKTGALVKKINLGDNAIVGDILAIDANKDYISEAVYFGTAYTSAGTWYGRIMSLAIPDDITNQVSNLCGSGDVTEATCASGLRRLFSGQYPFTASPDAAKDTLGNIWVYAGSGKYYSDVDEGDTSTQIFLGLKDSNPAGGYSTGDLDSRTGSVTQGSVTGNDRVCGYDGSSFRMLQYVTSINPTSVAVAASSNGWYYQFSDSERIISRPLAVGGLVDFLTYQPSSDPCSYGGQSYLYSLGYTNGVPPSNVSILSSQLTGGETHTGMGQSVTVQAGINLGKGAPPTGEAIIIPPPKEGETTLKKKIQVATGVIVETENQPVFNVVSQIVHWLRK